MVHSPRSPRCTLFPYTTLFRSLDVPAKLMRRMQAFAHRDRHVELAREARMARDVLRNRRLLVPVKVESLKAPAALECFVSLPGHVRIDHQVHAIADEVAHGADALLI